TLSPGTTYSAYLTFATGLFATQDDRSLMLERGFQSRTTRFSLVTTGSSGGETADLSDPQITGGTNLTFVLTGTPGTTYQLQSSPNLPVWTNEQTIALTNGATATVTIALPKDGVPRFYRAIAINKPPLGGPKLQLALNDTGQFVITLTGSPGTYQIQSSL